MDVPEVYWGKASWQRTALQGVWGEAGEKAKDDRTTDV